MSGNNFPRLEEQLIGMVTTFSDIKGHMLFILITQRRVMLLNERFFCLQQNCLHIALVGSAEHKRRTNRIFNRLFKEFIISVCLLHRVVPRNCTQGNNKIVLRDFYDTWASLLLCFYFALVLLLETASCGPF